MFRQKLNQALAYRKPFITDPINSSSIGISAVINILHVVILYSQIKPGSAQVLLRYNVLYGLTEVNKSIYVYGIPLLVFVLFVVNTMLAARFYYREKLAAYFLVISSIVLQLIFLAATLALIVANE